MSQTHHSPWDWGRVADDLRADAARGAGDVHGLPADLIARYLLDPRRCSAAEVERINTARGGDAELDRMLRQAEAGLPSGSVCVAEQQTAGRGRRGRPWVSPYAGNIYLSVLWRFAQGATALEGLSLAVGVAVATALERSGVQGVGLKWPNDVLHEGAKLGGILLEMVGDATGACAVVIGVGGVYYLHNPFLMVIALFVFLAGQAELQAAYVREHRRRLREEPLPVVRPVELSPLDLSTAVREPTPTAEGLLNLQPRVTVYVWDDLTGTWVKQPDSRPNRVL